MIRPTGNEVEIAAKAMAESEGFVWSGLSEFPDKSGCDQLDRKWWRDLARVALNAKAEAAS